MYFDLSEKEAFLIWSLRKGYCKTESVIWSLAGLPFGQEEYEQLLEGSGSNEQQHKEIELSRYYTVCEIQKKPPNISIINRITKKWDVEIADQRRRTIEENEQRNKTYNEFLADMEKKRKNSGKIHRI